MRKYLGNHHVNDSLNIFLNILFRYFVLTMSETMITQVVPAVVAICMHYLIRMTI